MTQIAFKGRDVQTVGHLPEAGAIAPDFTLVRQDLTEATLADYRGKRKLLNIFPSLDTDVCAASVKTFNDKAANLQNVAIINISKDLPFAHSRFCKQEGVHTETLSAFRSSFAQDYGLEIAEGALKGLCSRAVVVLDENNRVLYTQQVAEITDEPDYNAALDALK